MHGTDSSDDADDNKDNIYWELTIQRHNLRCLHIAHH